jgi:hypothetical protein
MVRMLRSQQDTLANPKERVPIMVRAKSERFPSERQLDWTGCDDFAPSPTDVVRLDKYRAHMKT